MKSPDKLTRYFAIGFIVSVALFPMFLYCYGPEWARWDAAQAVHYFRLGQVDDALFQLRDAIKKSPRDPVLKLTLASRLLDIKEKQPAEALQLAEAVLDVYKDNFRATEIKTLAQQHMGEFEEALETWLAFDKKFEAWQRGASTLNQLAYCRALANKDLHLARRDVEAAIKKTNESWPVRWPGDGAMSLPLRGIVLATIVARSCDLGNEALSLLTREIEYLEDSIETARETMTGSLYADLKNAFPVQPRPDTQKSRRELRILESRAAILLTCRALVYQDLGERVLSQNDRLSVSHFGFDSSVIAGNLPKDKQAVVQLQNIAAYLDTRGYVNYRLPWQNVTDEQQLNYLSNFRSAKLDLDVAIFCVEMDLESFKFGLHNSAESMDDPDEHKRMGKKHLGVMLNHRAMIFRRAGKPKLAATDEARVHELGMTPGPGLF